MGCLDVTSKWKRDRELADENTKELLSWLRAQFGEHIKGISVWGSVSEGYFMSPVDVTGFTDEQISLMRESDIPISGESKGSDIDAVVYVQSDWMQEAAEYVGSAIDELDHTLRFEHITLASYEDAIALFTKLRKLLRDEHHYRGPVQEVRCYFVISREAQEKTPFQGHPGRLSDTLFATKFARPFFEDAFLGKTYGLDEAFQKLLTLEEPELDFLKHFEEKAIRAEKDYNRTYLKKKRRYEALEKILNSE